MVDKLKERLPDLIKSKSFIITLSLVVVLGIIAGVIAYKIHRANVLSEAETLFKRGDYNGVISMFQESLGSPEERLFVARSHYRVHQFDQAQEALDPLIEYGKEHPEALALSGWIWLEKGSYAQAKKRFDQIEEVTDSRQFQALAQAGKGGVAYVRSEGVRSKDINEAKALLTRNLIEEFPIPEAYIYLAEVHHFHHEFERASEAAQKAVDLAPRWSKPYVVLGKSYLYDKMYNSAEDAFEQALHYGALEEETKYYLAQSQYFQGQLQDALNRLQEIIDLEGEMQRKALEDAARIHMILDQHQQALDYFMQAWEIQQNPVTGFQIFEIHTRQDHHSEAKELIRTLTRRWSFLAEAQLEKGNLLLKDGKYNDAYSAFNNVLDHDSQNVWANYNLGWLSFQEEKQFQTTDFFAVTAKNAEDFFPAQINYVISLLANKNLSEARVHIQDLVEEYPQNPHVIQIQALEHFLSNEYEACLERLNQVLDSQHQQASSWIIRGEVLMRMFEFEKARESFSKALEVDEDSILALLGLAHSSFRIGDVAQAQEIYQALNEKPDLLNSEMQTEVRNGLALCFLYQDYISNALDIWDQLENEAGWAKQMAVVNSTLVDAINPTSLDIEELEDLISEREREPLPETYYNLAIYYDKLGQRSEARNTYETLISRYPHFIYGLFNLAEHYRKRGRFHEAVTLFERARKMEPEWLDALNNEAAAYMNDDQFSQAYDLLQEAVAIDEESTMIQYNLSLVALHQNDSQKAQEHLEKLRQRGAVSNYTTMIEGLILARNQEWREAAQKFTSAVEQNEKDPYAPLNLGICLVKLKRYRQAEEALRMAVDRDPSLAVPHRALGMLYCQLGLFEEAKTMFEVSLHLEPDQQKIRTLLDQIQGWMRSE